MSKYNVCFEKEITMAKGSVSLDMDPLSFIHCKDEESLINEILDFFYNDIYYEGDIKVYESTTSLDVPEEFIKEWHKLKNEDNE